MLIRIFILMAIVLSGCGDDIPVNPLSMTKTPYSGDELRTDGYYYSTPTSEKVIGVAVFYRDGVCMHLFVNPTGQDTFDYIENRILGDNTLMSQLWKTPDQIGVFQVNQKSLKFEILEVEVYSTNSFSFFSEIINDTTFLLTKRINNSINKTFSENQTYRFKQFSPKPDSTNTFIK